MRAFVLVAALSIMLTAAPVHAQAPAAPPPDQTPAPVEEPAVGPQAVPFQDGFKYAYIDVQRIAANSADGKRANTEINALRNKLQQEIETRNKTLQSTQQKLETGASVLSESARMQLQTDAERQQRDLQRLLEDAQEDVERLTARLQQEFMEKLRPIIEKVAAEKQLHLLFNVAESGLVWAAPGMDLTNEVIKVLDGPGVSPAPR